jgi:hypothetical protein
MVMAPAEQHQVVEVGRTAIGPMPDVVGRDELEPPAGRGGAMAGQLGDLRFEVLERNLFHHNRSASNICVARKHFRPRFDTSIGT